MPTPAFTVLSRDVMHAMPPEWQARMTVCLTELADAETAAVEEALASHHDRTHGTSRDELAVFTAGEVLPGTDITLTYLYIATPHGPVRMTAEEAEVLGACLIHAAGYAHDIDMEDQP